VATTTNATVVAQGVKVMETTNNTPAEIVSRNQEITESLIQAHKEYAKLLEQAQRDLRELSERCFQYGDFDGE
jgi:serine kinase of HPr protein (carbohydrate metabolism regulator)